MYIYRVSHNPFPISCSNKQVMVVQGIRDTLYVYVSQMDADRPRCPFGYDKIYTKLNPFSANKENCAPGQL